MWGELLLRWTTAAALTPRAAPPWESWSTAPSGRGVRVGPHASPAEACAAARHMGRRTASRGAQGVRRLPPRRRAPRARGAPSPSAGSGGRQAAGGVPTFALRPLRPLLALLRPWPPQEDLLQGTRVPGPPRLPPPPPLRPRERGGLFSPPASSPATEKNGPTSPSASGAASRRRGAGPSGPYLTPVASLQHPGRWPPAPPAPRPTRAEAYAPAPD